MNELEVIRELLTKDTWTKVDCKAALGIRNRYDGFETSNCFCTQGARREWRKEVKYWYEGVTGVTRGFGDTVAKVTKFFGVEPCAGCKERQDALNKVIPYDGTRD